jgi:hypothetical protein
MGRLYGCLLVLTCSVVVLCVGSVLPRLVFAGEGAGAYSGEKRAFARFALVYDLDLKEWPFPIDPTVARRVTEVSGTHDEGSPCNTAEIPEGGPYDTGDFAGDYRAEVVHYGPFFVPTGKNVFDCDVARTYSFFLPGDTDGILVGVLAPVVFMGAFGLAIGTAVVTVFLIVGGGILLARGSEWKHRVVGLAAGASGTGLAATAFFAVATTAI